MCVAAGADLTLGTDSHRGDGKFGDSGVVGAIHGLMGLALHMGGGPDPNRHACAQLLRDHGCPDYSDSAAMVKFGGGAEPTDMVGGTVGAAITAMQSGKGVQEAMRAMHEDTANKRARMYSPEAAAGELRLVAIALRDGLVNLPGEEGSAPGERSMPETDKPGGPSARADAVREYQEQPELARLQEPHFSRLDDALEQRDVEYLNRCFLRTQDAYFAERESTLARAAEAAADDDG